MAPAAYVVLAKGVTGFSMGIDKVLVGVFILLFVLSIMFGIAHNT
jgi:uncharacterized membrane protein YtjA (UPF0391 family)